MTTAAGKLFNRDYICVLINVVCMNLGFNMLSTIVTPYALTLGATLTGAGLVTGVMSIAAMCVRPFTGITSDMLSPRKLLFAGALGTAAVIFGCSALDDVRILFALRIVHGILFSITTTAAMAFTRGCIPSARLGEGMGYYGVAQALASAVGPNLGLALSRGKGYSSVFLIAAGLTVLASVSSLWLTVEPQRCIGIHSIRNITLKKIFAVEALPFLLICFILGSIGALDGSFLALYGRQEGISDVGWYFTLQALALIGSKFLLGKVSDKLPFRVILIAGSTLIGGAYVSLSLLGRCSAAFILVLAAVLRATGVGLLQPAVQAACFKSVEPSRSGAASATNMLEMDFGVGSAPVLGAMLQKHVGFSGMYLCYLVPLTFAVTTYLIYDHMRKGEQL